MKSTMFTVAATLSSIAVVFAIECPVTVIDPPTEKTPMEVACPSLYVRGANAINPRDLTTITPASLQALEPCKEDACLAELNKVNATDCTFEGLNLKAFHEATLTLCEAFNAGPVSVEAATAVLKDVYTNATIGADNSSSTDTDTTTPTVTTDAPADSSEKPAAVPSPTSAPAPASGASVTVVVSSAAIVGAAALVTTVLL